MGIERGRSKVDVFRLVMVVEQHAHAHTAIGSPYQPLRHDPTGGVDVPDVILRIQRLFGQVGHGQAGRESITSLSHQAKPGLPRVPIRRFLKERADGGGLRLSESRRRRARVIPVDCGAAPAQQEDQSKSRDQALEQAKLDPHCLSLLRSGPNLATSLPNRRTGHAQSISSGHHFIAGNDGHAVRGSGISCRTKE
jgi:hypothetical protein